MNTENLYASAKTGLKRAFDFFNEPSEEKKQQIAFRESVQVKFARIEAALTSAENTRNDVFNASTNRFEKLDESIASSETQRIVAFNATTNQTAQLSSSGDGRRKKDIAFQENILEQVGNLGDQFAGIGNEMVNQIRIISTAILGYHKYKNDFHDEAYEQILKVKNIVTSTNKILKHAQNEVGIHAQVERRANNRSSLSAAASSSSSSSSVEAIATVSAAVPASASASASASESAPQASALESTSASTALTKVQTFGTLKIFEYYYEANSCKDLTSWLVLTWRHHIFPSVIQHNHILFAKGFFQSIGFADFNIQGNSNEAVVEFSSFLSWIYSDYTTIVTTSQGNQIIWARTYKESIVQRSLAYMNGTNSLTAVIVVLTNTDD